MKRFPPELIAGMSDLKWSKEEWRKNFQQIQDYQKGINMEMSQMYFQQSVLATGMQNTLDREGIEGIRKAIAATHARFLKDYNGGAANYGTMQEHADQLAKRLSGKSELED
jgi:hypothetical protein